MEIRSLTLLAVVAALAVGFGAGFVVGNDGRPSGHSDGSVLAQRSEDDAASPSTGGAPLAPPAARPSRAAPRGPSAEEVLARGRRSAISAGAGDTPAGDGVIRGGVVDEDGDPISGATVVAIPRASDGGGEVELRTEVDLGRGWRGGAERTRSLEDYVRRRLASDERRRVATSGADGSFELDGLAATTHSVRAYLEGHDADWEIVEIGARATLVMRAVGVYVLDPRLPDGTQPEEAAVLVQGSRSLPVPYRWTRDEPAVRLAGRRARIAMASTDLRAASRDAYMASFMAAERVVDLDGDGNGPHRFDLVEATGLTVTLEVQGDLGRDRRHVVEVSALGSDAWGRLERVSDRVFATAEVEPGPHLVRVSRQDHSSIAGLGESLTEQAVQLEPGLNEASVAVEGPREEDFLVVTCVDEGGRGLEIDRISYLTEYPSGGSSGGARPTIRPGGEHWIEWATLTSGRDDVTSVTLTLSDEFHGSVSRTVTPDTERLEVVMGTPCEVTVEVRGLADGANAKVSIATVVEESSDGTSRTTHGSPSKEVPPAGVVVFDAVQPGEYEFQLQPGGFAIRANVLARKAVRVSGEAMTVRLEAPALHPVEIVAPDALPDSQVMLQSDVGSDQSFYDYRATDESDVATFENVPAGRYRVRIRATGGSREMLITVPCGRVRFEPSEVVGHRVTKVQDGTVAAAMGFQEGDVLVGDTEERIDSQASLGRIFAKALDGPVTLVVERSGREIHLTLPRPEDGVPYTHIGIWTESILR